MTKKCGVELRCFLGTMSQVLSYFPLFLLYGIMLHRTIFFAVIFLSAIGLSAERLTAEELTLKQTGTGYEVFIGENIFAGYLTDFRGTPVLFRLSVPPGNT